MAGKKRRERNSQIKRRREIKHVPLSLDPDKEHDEEARFNFGGLPARDLKKNLGCG